MVETSTEYKTAIKESNRRFSAKATIALLDGNILEIQNEDIMQGGIGIEDGVSSQNVFEIGAVVIGELSLSLYNLDDRFSAFDFNEAVIDLYIGLTLPDQTIEWIPKGIYTVDEAISSHSVINITALNNMSKFDRPYSQSTLTYPRTLAEILRDACANCDVPLKTQEFNNSSYVVSKRPEDEKFTFREVVSWVSQLAGRFARINHVGALCIEWYDYERFLVADDIDGGTFIDYTSGDNVDGGNFKDYSSGDKAIGGVFRLIPPPVYVNRLKSCEIVTENITITGVQIVPVNEEQQTYISGEDGYVITIEKNPLAQDNLEELTFSLGEILNGFTFRPYKVDTLSDPCVEAGDVTLITDIKGNQYESFISNLSYTIGSYETYSGDAESQSSRQSTRYSASSKAVQTAKVETENLILSYDLDVQQLNSLIINSIGMYQTVERLSNGKVICYMHDKPYMSQSTIIWRKTEYTFSVSFDGGNHWEVMTNASNTVAKVLASIGINADWINSGTIKPQNISQDFKDAITSEINSMGDTKPNKNEIALNINQVSQSELINSTKINLSNYPSFSSLSTSGSSNINADNITTGKIVNSSNPYIFFDVTNGVNTASRLANGSAGLTDLSASIGSKDSLKGLMLSKNNNAFLSFLDKSTNNLGAEIITQGDLSLSSESGEITFWTNGISSASIKNTGGYFADLYTNGVKVTSDRDKKENIEPVSFSALDKVDKLNFHSYDLKENKTHVDIGIMFDEAPNEIKSLNEEKTIDLYSYISLLAKAVKELSEKVNKQNIKINKLEGMM